MANIKLKKPQIGSHAWGDSINENFAKIENNLNSVSTEMSALQHDLYSMRQLTISGAIKISETIFNENDGNQGYITLKLKVYNFKDNGIVETTGVETDIINIPTNTCYKVIEKYDELKGTNKLDPQSIEWAKGDFFVVGELINTTKTFSRLPISIGMYMKPSLGTNENEGKLVWTPTMAETNPNIVAMSLPIQYAYGTVKGYRITKDNLAIKIGLADGNIGNIPITGTNGFTYFPDIRFYQKVNGILQKVEINYKLDRVTDLNIGDKLSTLYFNTEKTNDEIIAMCEKFDWDNAPFGIPGLNKRIQLLTTEKQQTNYLYIEKILDSSYGDLNNPYSIRYIENDIVQGFWSQTSGNINSSTTAFNGQIVKTLNEQDNWKDFIYEEKNVYWQVTLNFDNNNDDYAEDIYMYVTMITSSSPEVNTTEQ